MRVAAEKFEELPVEQGVYRVVCISGTTHIVHVITRMTWTRLPSPSSQELPAGGRPQIVRAVQGVRRGESAFVEFSDADYLTGNSWLRTSQIEEISRESSACQRCGNQALRGRCWRCVFVPGWPSVSWHERENYPFRARLRSSLDTLARRFGG